MANNTQLDSRPSQISKGGDLHGPDIPIPLSPQWLLPKSGESKSKVVPVESHFGGHQGYVNRSDISKSPGTYEEKLDNDKKKDIFRPSVLNMESRWRDEERDTNSSSVRKENRWKDGDKVDRWTESSGKHYGETRRAPPERWVTDSGNKDTTHNQVRDSKWSSRWGHDEKEPNSVGPGREKWVVDPTKDADVSQRSPNLPYNGNGDHNRPWRSSNRGRGDPLHYQALTPNKPGPTFGRGSDNNSPRLQKHGSFSEKVDPSLLKYNRAKLLDIYQVTDMYTGKKYLEGAVQVPSLTEEEPIQPLALYGPTPEELAIFKGIENGDIVSSDVPQTTKGGPTGPTNSDASMVHGHTSVPNVGMWRAPSLERANSASRQTQKDHNNEWVDSSYPKREGQKWQTGNNNNNDHMKRQELETTHKLSHTQPNPEDLVLYYKDPQGKIQGPFTGIDILGWFEAGYLGIDLPVRLANAPPDTPFSLLGDVMPHLRAKAGPPPGFGASKVNELADAPLNGSNFSTFGKLQVGPSDINMVNNEPRYVHDLAKEAETRYIESLMNQGVPLSEGLAGMQGYHGNNTGGENSYLYAQKLALERQRSSLQNPYSYWPGGPTSKPEVIQQEPRPQNTDLISMLQSALERSSNNGVVNNNNNNNNMNGASAWSNFPQNTPEKLLSQDPQLLSYLMQLQSPVPAPVAPPPVSPQQMLLLEKLLLLKQEEQQKQFLMRQQNQLLSQMLSQQRVAEAPPSYGQLHSPGFNNNNNAPLDHHHNPWFQTPVPILQDERNNPNFVVPSGVPLDNSETSSVLLTHQNQRNWSEQFETMQQKGSLESEIPNVPSLDQTFQTSESYEAAPLGVTLESNVDQSSKVNFGNELVGPEEVNYVEEEPAVEVEQFIYEESSVVVEEVTSVEMRETKKSEKKSKKSKASKTQSSDSAKEVSNEVTNSNNVKPEIQIVDSQVGLVSQSNAQVSSGQRAWKPAPGFKPKSFLEIQQEEQSRAQAQAEMAVSEISTSLNSMNVSSPWSGLVANSDNKSFQESSENIVAKPTEREVVISDSIEEASFIEAKDTKKSRKKSGKAKGNTGSKAASAPEPIVKGKNSRQTQEEVSLPVAPSGPSLGDFVVWKGESASPVPAPAWSSNLSKPTCLRDILKEQERKTPFEKKQIAQTTQKSVPNAKHSGDDELFWGPISHSKHESKQSDFPQLGGKDTLSKGGSLNLQKKPVSGRGASDYKLSSSPAQAHSTKKGKKGALTKESEASDFKEWCETECNRLIGSKDTSFLEFCLKQSRSEAETLLIENLGSVDPDHVFIEKFLNYKDFLSPDVLAMAFQIHPNDAIGFGGPKSSGPAAPEVVKKKGKKGKKMSPFVLGFNVVSTNRIMMGEIQTVED